MTAPQSKARRRRYAGRNHQVVTRPPTLEQRRDTRPVSVVPDEVSWKVLPGTDVAHAFSSGPGWMRSACREIRWTVLAQEPAVAATRCDDCSLLVDGAPGEITEAWGK